MKFTHHHNTQYALRMPHPAVLIFVWVCLAVATQTLSSRALLGAGAALLIVAYMQNAARLRSLLRRTRWILFSLLLIYAYVTPGTALWPALAQFSPTLEGLYGALLQLSRIVAALAALAILLNLLSRQQLVSGLYVLAYPLRFVGIARERAAVRLALTLHYAESALTPTTQGWRARMDEMLTQPDGESTFDDIELHCPALTLRDGLLAVGAGAALIWVLL